ncbi:MAG: hypothetical protein E5W65_25650 [Mesorhizobium sp.]|uniref:hypothetical protein n=1 Tax=Mesorhizobium sp. TaxID=1871066 RepID=UPI001221E021|nr:hypothetical protein [Mesorhizobium sp.]TIT32296.1 MAG: hypothetical protein E5W65_25650 [Mesorhizobium sp.]
MDARHGGLIVGRDGPDDDIPMYQFIGDGIFEICGLMHGREYIVSREAALKHVSALQAINSETGTADADLPLRFSPRSAVINTNLMPPGGAIWVDPGQYIINRFATAKHLDSLEKLNAKGNPASYLTIGLPEV